MFRPNELSKNFSIQKTLHKNKDIFIQQNKLTDIVKSSHHPSVQILCGAVVVTQIVAISFGIFCFVGVVMTTACERIKRNFSIGAFFGKKNSIQI